MFHFDAVVQEMIINGIWETLYMTLASTFMGYVLGLPLGIALAVTDKTGIRPQPVVYRVLDVISNVLRSIPFIILLILVIPLTRFIVGQSYGSSATVVPLVIAAAPFIGRMVESSLKEVDHGVIEAAQSMGAGIFTIIWKVLLVEARTSLIVRCDDRTWYNPWILRNGRRCRRRRSGKYRNSVWLLSLSAGYHDRNDRYFDCPRSNFAGNWNVDLCKA